MAVPDMTPPDVTQADQRLWIDRDDALYRIADRLAAGRMNRVHAAMLRGLIADGYCVLNYATDREDQAAAARDIDRMLAGACPDALIACPEFGDSPSPWSSGTALRAACVLDPHYLSGPVRAALLSERLTRFLGVLLEAPVLLAKSRAGGRWREKGGRTPGLTVWLALEDGTGLDWAPTVYPGTHRGGADGCGTPVTLTPSAGDAVVFHPAVIRGYAGGSKLTTRRFVEATVDPAPSAEAGTGRLHAYAPHVFASALYPHLEPLD